MATKLKNKRLGSVASGARSMREGSMGRTTKIKIPLLAAAALLLTLATGGVSRAQNSPLPGVVANQPGATLVLPYFEVDLNNHTPQGDTTTIQIFNTSQTAILSHLEIYSDLGVPAFGFDVYLTGYGVYRLNLQQLLVSGNLPQKTASAGQDPMDTISPQGPDSQDINFASCNGILPITSTLSPSVLLGLQNALTGQPSGNFGNMCLGQNIGDGIARGYITVDTTDACTTLNPSDADYFDGIVTDQNVLAGDVFYVNPSKNHAVALPLISLIADANNPATSSNGRYTFYGKFDNWSAIDNREPTSTTFAPRYINAGSPQGLNFINQGTTEIVWRDSKVAQGPFLCSTTPSWYPLLLEGMIVFDEQEHPQVPPVCLERPCPVIATEIPYPAVTQKTVVGGPELATSFNEGWIYLDLNQSNTAAGMNPSFDPAAAQAWVISLYDQGIGGGGNNPNAIWEMGEKAPLLDSAENANHFVP
jgi:hypothetical protein